jgi:hypothetical protein
MRCELKAIGACWSSEIEASGATGSWVVLVDHKLETGSVDCEIDFRWW